MRISIYRFFLMIVILFFVECRQEKKVTLSVYDWETRVPWSEDRSHYVQNMHVEQLYVKVLETNGVDVINTEFQGPIPVGIAFVPVIRLNGSYFDLQSSSIAGQSTDFIHLIKQFEERYKIHFANEIQFDFDYTDLNRENYFELLRSIKQQSKKEISITLNLEKLKDRVHLPPVCYCMLMLYDFQSSNADIPNIFDKQQLDAYATFVEQYPLSLHFAIACFSRTLVKSKNKIFALQHADFEMLKNDAHFLFSGDGRYEVLSDFNFHDQYLQKGDVIYIDEAAISKVQESIAFIRENYKEKDSQIAFFSLNSTMMKRFSAAELQQAIEALKQ